MLKGQVSQNWAQDRYRHGKYSRDKFLGLTSAQAVLSAAHSFLTVCD